jgi:hypothetical protein
MALLFPARPNPAVSRPTDDRPVLALVDSAQPMEPVLHRAALTASEQGAPLVVVLLHPRLGLTTDAAIAARHWRQLDVRRDAATEVLDRVLDEGTAYAVHLVPYAGRPWRDPAGQLRRAAQRCRRLIPAREVIMAEPLLGADVGR